MKTSFWKQLNKPIKALAPMEDVTDTVFRQLVAECGKPDVFFTEFTNAHGMFDDSMQVKHRLRYTQKERPIVAQIWGKEPKYYKKAAQKLVKMGFDGIDINMGCPVKKITKQGCCSALIKNKPLAKKIIQATKEGAEGLPVSVKTRIGFDKIVTKEWAEFLLEQDIEVLTIHGRTSRGMNGKPANWNEIAKVVEVRNKRNMDTLIIGNGDVMNYEDIVNMYKKYSVDGVMVARGIFNDPYVFNPNKSFKNFDIEEKLSLLEKHIKMFSKEWGSKKNVSILKRFFKNYLKDFENASNLRAKLMEKKTSEGFLKVIKEFKKDNKVGK